jgi:TIR domain
MATVAISYRRADTGMIAGRVYDRLVSRYGEKAVFFDLEKIPYGADFQTYIRQTLLQTKVLIALIGEDWLGVGADGSVRMNNADDPVRIEIETALAIHIPIIPVLIDGARMPESRALPATFANFVYLNAPNLSSGSDFRDHMKRLIAAINQAAAGTGPTMPLWRDTLRYLLVPLVALLFAHYEIVNALDLNLRYLWLTCVLLPFAAGFALVWIGRRSADFAAACAVGLGVLGAAGMTVSSSLYSGEPIMPQGPSDWRDNFEFAATIALSAIAGYLLAWGLRWIMQARLGKV